MHIRRNKKLEGQIMDRAREWLESQDRADGIHVSSLLTPRKHYFAVIKPKPLTDKEVGFFIAGRAHHEVLLSAMKRKAGIEAKTEEESREWNEIFYTPDFRLGFLAEIKTNRRQYAPPEDEASLLKDYDNYLQQLSKYMAVENVECGSLIVFYISLRHDDANKTTYPTILCYDVTLTQSERTGIKKDMLEARDLIRKAIKKKDHTILPLCPAWQCTRGGFRGPVIEECKWYRDCKPEGRYPLTQIESNIAAEKAAKKKRRDDDD